MKDPEDKLKAVAAAAKALQSALNDYGRPLDVDVRMTSYVPLGVDSEMASFEVTVTREERLRIHP